MPVNTVQLENPRTRLQPQDTATLLAKGPDLTSISTVVCKSMSRAHHIKQDSLSYP